MAGIGSSQATSISCAMCLRKAKNARTSTITAPPASSATSDWFDLEYPATQALGSWYSDHLLDLGYLRTVGRPEFVAAGEEFDQALMAAMEA
jgi:hypothetical protein